MNIAPLSSRFHGAKDMDQAMSLGRFVEILPLVLLMADIQRRGSMGS